jgi:eukaryotic-like serine/threonine-protein kinase
MSQQSPRSIPQQGEIIAGKYRVERVLGVGGMGVVVAAQHVRLDEKVALKFLLPEALVNGEAVSRFEREARAASKIKSEHVARVSDVGTLDNGSPYMVMEYLEGTDLSGWLEKQGAMPVSQAVDFVLQACEALAEAHSLGIVHRDLKPANLFCIQRPDGQLCVKVLDFGISKLTAPGSDVAMTRTTALLGSPLYMSPEQMMMSKGVDARTDIWSLGTILFELVTGKPPFDAESVTELAIKIATQPHTPVRSLRADVPAAFEQTIAKCLDKDRALRFQTVADLAVALADFAPPHARLSVERVVATLQRAGMSPVAPGTANPNAATALAPGGVGPQTGASWGQTGPAALSPPRPGKSFTVPLGLGLLAIVVIVGSFAVRRVGGYGPSLAAAPSAMSAEPATSAPPVVVDSHVAAEPPPTASAEVAPVVSSAAKPTTLPSEPAHETPAARRTQTRATALAPPSPAAGAPASAASPQANCNPPYIINSAGQHQYKPECL